MKNLLLALPGAGAALLGAAALHLVGDTPSLWIATGVVGFIALLASLYVLFVIESRPQRHPWLSDIFEPRKVQRDVTLREAIDRICTGKWDKPKFLSGFKASPHTGEGAINRALAQVRQHARDGTLPIWGRASRHQALEPIPQDFWSKGRINIFSIMKADPEECETEDQMLGSPRRWMGLMTSRKVVEELWPTGLIESENS